MTFNSADPTAHANERPLVAIYREMLLNYNEPFITQQANALHRYRPFFVGTRRSDVRMPRERSLVLRDCFHALDARLDRWAKLIPDAPLTHALHRGQLVGRASE